MAKRPSPPPPLSSKPDEHRLAPIAPAVTEILGSPPLLPDEDIDVYNALHDKLRSAVEPSDIIEELWVRDVVDLSWQIARLRRLGATLLAACSHEGLDAVLKKLAPGYDERERLVRGWARRERSTLSRVRKLLAKAGLERDAVDAQTLAIKIHEFERIDVMTAQCEKRRNDVLREIDRHRASVAARLRQATADIEDAEFEDGDGRVVEAITAAPANTKAAA